VTAKDARSVVFTLSAPFADLPVTLAYTNAKIVPAAVIKSGLARLDREAVGTGPFKLVSFEPERQVVLTRNDAYYDKARPYLDRIQIVVYPGQHRRSLGADRRRHRHDLDDDADRIPAARESRRHQGDAHAVGAVLQRQFRLRLEAVQRRAHPAGAGDDDRPPGDGAVRHRRLRDAGNDTPLNPAYRYYADQPLKKPDIAKAKALLAEPAFRTGSMRR
jgi:peptide/nickel transport system substrate-binding protein